MTITFIAAVNNRAILENNLLASPALRGRCDYQIILQEHYSSAAQAYNEAANRSANDLMIFIHQDMFLPFDWIPRLLSQIAMLEVKDPKWGVVGCWGATQKGEDWGHVYSPGQGVIGHQFGEPKEVQTLDEIVLVTRRSSGLRFDEKLPHYHLYGTDLCLAAKARGLHVYAISVFCIHNSRYLQVLPAEFYECYAYVKRKWATYLPIQTSCIRISRFDGQLRKRKIKEWWRTLQGDSTETSRVNDPRELCSEMSRMNSFD